MMRRDTPPPVSWLLLDALSTTARIARTRASLQDALATTVRGDRQCSEIMDGVNRPAPARNPEGNEGFPGRNNRRESADPAM